MQTLFSFEISDEFLLFPFSQSVYSILYYFRGFLMSSCDTFFEGFSTFFLGKFSLLIFTRRQLKMGFLLK